MAFQEKDAHFFRFLRDVVCQSLQPCSEEMSHRGCIVNDNQYRTAKDESRIRRQTFFWNRSQKTCTPGVRFNLAVVGRLVCTDSLDHLHCKTSLANSRWTSDGSEGQQRLGIQPTNEFLQLSTSPNECRLFRVRVDKSHQWVWMTLGSVSSAYWLFE